MTISDVARKLRNGEVSSEELVRASLAAIDLQNPALNAFITITSDSALAHAREMDQMRSAGQPCGPLCGIPIALKDVFSTQGIRTTCGSKLFENHVPVHDCTVAAKLKAAGAILVGKTGLHELAYGVTSTNPHFGMIRNPWNTGAIPGGSSGGSGVAVASGMVFAAMGSDTGGSIRIPAAYCGIVGLKPTSGRISRYGVMPLDYTLDHMGPMTRSVRDAALLLQVLAGHDELDDSSSRRAVDNYEPPLHPSLEGIRVGVPENFFFERVDEEVDSAVRGAIRAARERGAKIVPIRLPDVAAINIVGRVILICEASALLERHLDQPSLFGDDVRLLLEQGRLIPATAYINAQRLRRQMQRTFATIWTKVDCLFTPATPITAPPIGATAVRIGDEDEDVRIASTRFARSFNVLGIPAISVPCGFDAKHMPIGLQIVAAAFEEAKLLYIAEAMENALGLSELNAPQG